jgi:hypothetical protein
MVDYLLGKTALELDKQALKRRRIFQNCHRKIKTLS